MSKSTPETQHTDNLKKELGRARRSSNKFAVENRELRERLVAVEAERTRAITAVRHLVGDATTSLGDILKHRAATDCMTITDMVIELDESRMALVKSKTEHDNEVIRLATQLSAANLKIIGMDTNHREDMELAATQLVAANYEIDLMKDSKRILADQNVELCFEKQDLTEQLKESRERNTNQSTHIQLLEGRFNKLNSEFGKLTEELKDKKSNNLNQSATIKHLKDVITQLELDIVNANSKLVDVQELVGLTAEVKTLSRDLKHVKADRDRMVKEMVAAPFNHMYVCTPEKRKKVLDELKAITGNIVLVCPPEQSTGLENFLNGTSWKDEKSLLANRTVEQTKVKPHVCNGEYCVDSHCSAKRKVVMKNTTLPNYEHFINAGWTDELLVEKGYAYWEDELKARIVGDAPEINHQRELTYLRADLQSAKDKLSANGKRITELTTANGNLTDKLRHYQDKYVKAVTIIAELELKGKL
tara:strand:- start:5733 stop:7157 length:1425 start_codon:yes stop_codon:yes gene_type:complete